MAMADTIKVLVPTPQNDQLAETIGESMDIIEAREPWSEYAVLEDGTKIKSKQTVINIVKLDQKNPDGTKETTTFLSFNAGQSLVNTTAIEALFNYWYEKWHEEVKYQSSIDTIINNSYFKKIVTLGYNAVPYIVDALKETPSHLFMALYEITGENPIKSENRGKIKEMVNDWLEWWGKNDHAAIP
jgi:hypothetical protein